MLHVVVWEEANGPVPKGMIVVFKDGDTMNVTLENLEIITRQEAAARTRQTNEYIAKTLSHKSGGKGLYDKEMYEELLNHPDLLEAKRNQLKLNQSINGK